MAAPGAHLTTTTSARASKTWVLPPRAKPGRKSKKDTVAATNASGEEEDQEKNASRTKQKASRERKQEYIVELEAKVRSYEQGDGERASFFQELAKKYSDERDLLKQENEDLRRRLTVYEPSGSGSPTAPMVTRKASSDLINRSKRTRTRSDSIASGSSSSSTAALPTPLASTSGSRTTTIPHYINQTQPTNAYRVVNASDAIPGLTYAPPSPPISSDQSYRRASTSSSTQADGCGLCDKTSSTQCICDEIGLRPSPDELAASAAAILATSSIVSCGMCDETASTECICRQMGLDPSEVSAVQTSPPSADCGFCEGSEVSSCICRDMGIRKTSNTPKASLESADSPLVVPLRGIRKVQKQSQPIWRIDNAQVSKPIPSGPAAASVALRRSLIKVGSRLPCSGDPRSCPACADDPAGQAFCSALSSTVCSTNPCATCPNRPSPLSKEVQIGPSQSTAMPQHEELDRQSLRRRDSSTRDEVPEAMIPCSDAWARLRAHPNIGFANLDLLANVVAKRTHCMGEKRDRDGKVIEVGREGVEEALDLLDHVRD